MLKDNMKKILQNILRHFGYLKVDYGFACGRHWISIDDKIIAQTPKDDVWLKDEDVHRMGYIICDKGKHWTKPENLTE